MRCRNCGKEIQDNSKFCEGCGSKIDKMKQTPSYNQCQTNSPSKKNTKLIITISIISAVVLIGLVILIIHQVGGGESSAHSLECTYKSTLNQSMEQETTLTLYFNDDETEIKKLKVKTVVYLPDDGDPNDGKYFELDEDDFKKQMKESLQTSACDQRDLDSCSIDVTMEKTTIEAVGTSKDALSKYEGLTIKETKEKLEKQGLSCK